MSYHRYTEGEKQFLTENIKNYTYKELAIKFNQRFGANVSMQSISDICTKRLKIHREKNTGKFVARGDRPYTRNIGSEVWRSGYVFVKISDNYHDGITRYAQMSENWQPKHRYIYEQANGRISADDIVVFLDGNNTNFDIENLYCVSRKINVVMNRNRWFVMNREATLAAIKWCELFYALREA